MFTKGGTNMKVIVKNKTSFQTIQIENVSAISYSNGVFTITAGGTTSSYSQTAYCVFILNK